MVFSFLIALLGIQTSTAETKQIRFDPYFLHGISRNQIARPLVETPSYFIAAPGINLSSQSSVGNSQNVDLAFEIFRVFIEYVNQFHEDNDRAFAKIGDFRAFYSQKLLERWPNVFVQLEAYRLSAQTTEVVLGSQGGGIGLRVDMKAAENHQFSFSFLPIAVEQRSFGSLHNHNALINAGGNVRRISAGLSYKYKMGPLIEPGAQIVFQPQVFDLGEFRIYAEAFIRLKLKTINGRKLFQIDQLSLVPKVVYWGVSDQIGLSDAASNDTRYAYERLNSNVYGFLNLEFRFQM